MTGQTIVIVGNGYWAKGNTLQEAKLNFNRHGGKLRNGYDVATFEPGTEFKGVDRFGSAHYVGNAPTVVTVAAKKAATK